jgi:activating signal cointegrator complex subunit 3
MEGSSSGVRISPDWLLEECAKLPSASVMGGPLPLAVRVQEACAKYAAQEMQLQTSLFDIVGMEAFDFLTTVVQHASTIKTQITRAKLEQAADDMMSMSSAHAAGASSSHNTDAASASSSFAAVAQQAEPLPQWEIEENLKNEALDALQTAAMVKTQVDAATSSGASGARGMTHVVTRASHKQLFKDLKHAQRRAATALDRARKAGVIIEDYLPQLADPKQEALFREEAENFAHTKGIDGMSAIDIQNMLAHQLAPEGTKQHYANSFSNSAIQGLPAGTKHEYLQGYEQVTIPAKVMDQSQRRTRIKIKDVMGPAEQQAFAGTASLNPMQSEVFEAAFHTQENLLICAPTGAGKTNVAMLAVVNHFRERGIIAKDSSSSMGNGNPKNGDKQGRNSQQKGQQRGQRQQQSEHRNNDSRQDHGNSIMGVMPGAKVVYVAPMKALAQEVVEKFDSKLKPLKISVKELTGDMQLTKAEAERADIIVTTPEKWDVVTRKGGDGSLSQSCGLLIIDEIHLLADDRGAVIESVVARLHRTVESSQRQVRLVGLSATLPNYRDVAQFLRVDAQRGLFFFGPEHRPVPLEQTLMGITGPAAKNRHEKERKMNQLAYDVVSDSLRRGYQIMVFVHSRKGTGQTATALAELAEKKGEWEELFLTEGTEENGDAYKLYSDKAATSRNREVSNHFLKGMGIHHAGMLRGDRKLTEQMFADGAIKVLFCTATLAWGINLPAHTVVIKGTEIYNPEKGGNVDLSILDVMQIFGRAGRPQYDKFGEAFLITTQDAFLRYLDKLVREVPIESNFIKQLPDHLNAEIVAGTVANIQEAAEWLNYTYLYVRMCRNPLVYGVSTDQKHDDPFLKAKCIELVKGAAKMLDELRMITYDVDSGNVANTDMGRVASYYYIQTESVATFNEMLDRKPFPSEADLIHVVCCAKEFENVKVRQDEMEEMDKLAKKCHLKVIAPVEEFSGKSAVLLQSYISRLKVTGFTLISDTNYIAQNGGRVARGLFEMCLKRQKVDAALKLLWLCQSLDKKVWWDETPLRQFEGELPSYCLDALESRRIGEHQGYTALESALALLDMTADEVGVLVHSHNHMTGEKIQRFVKHLPRIDATVTVLPLTSSILRFQVTLTPNFTWSPRWHGGALGFWVWVEDAEQTTVYHHEYVVFSRRTHPEPTELEMNIPVFPPVPEEYYLRIVSDTWVGCHSLVPVPLQHVSLPERRTPFTQLLDLTPLPVSALQDERFEQIYRSRFESFNPIQTQVFHVLYHTDTPVLLGAPTGSGKTVVAELALMRLKRQRPHAKCVYIAPLKSLARERLKEWKKRFGAPTSDYATGLGWKVLELTGDTHHDARAINNADVLVCTPEKWDLVSRGWRSGGGGANNSNNSQNNNRSFVKDVGLLIIDEIHLLGEERGAVLEAIVSRARLIANKDGKGNGDNGMARIVGLSTALANPNDLADWMGIDVTPPKASSNGGGRRPTNNTNTTTARGLYNFRPSVRPVPIMVHFKGFAGRHYVPRMASMNKPAYAAIQEFSPIKPVLIFVSSRRQTRLTAMDLISYAAGDESPSLFLGCDHAYMEAMAQTASDEALRHTLVYGIGLHHAGLSPSDRELVETLYLQGYIQVLVATATLAWGVNLPAHLVIIKGTEYFDKSRYVDYPVTDVLQMMGRAGRPQFDTEATACIFVSEDKKAFYKKFLYEPFPVESCFGSRMAENMNAEVAAGTIRSLKDAVDYLSLTYYARRVKKNPSFYGAASGDDKDVETFVLNIVQQSLLKLEDAGCITVNKQHDSKWSVKETLLGRTASSFYLHHQTPQQMLNSLKSLGESFAAVEHGSSNKKVDNIRVDQDFNAVDKIFMALAFTLEFDDMPVRFSEDELNTNLASTLPWGQGMKKLLFRYASTGSSSSSSTNNKKKSHQISDADLMSHPHVKCYLVMQAFLHRVKLPNNDYMNDTRSLMDQLPRLLAAFHSMAAAHLQSQSQASSNSGGIDLFAILVKAKQVLTSRLPLSSDPLEQIPYVSEETSSKLKEKDVAFRDLCEMSSEEAHNALSDAISGGNNNNARRLSTMVQYLQRVPSITINKARSSFIAGNSNTNNSKKSKAGVCTVILNVYLKDRGNNNNAAKNKSPGTNVSVIVGSAIDRRLLAYKSIFVNNSGANDSKKSVEVKLHLDNCGTIENNEKSTNSVIVRVMEEEVRGLDVELEVTADTP